MTHFDRSRNSPTEPAKTTARSAHCSSRLAGRARMFAAGAIVAATVSAMSVAVASPSYASTSSSSAVGKVGSVDRSADTFTVETSTGSTVKVKVTSSTSYRDSAVKSASFTNVKVGTSVAVIGSSSAGVETATSVIIGGSTGSGTGTRGGGGFGGFGGAGGPTAGKVTSVDRSADTFKIKTSKGSTVKVKVTSSTSYRDSAVKSASFANVKVGATIAVVGSTSAGVETAKFVILGTPRRPTPAG